MSVIDRRFGGVSTRIKDLIMEYVGYEQQQDDFVLRKYCLTTQTIVIELSGVRFNDFRVEVGVLSRVLNQEKRLANKLRSIQSKRFAVFILEDRVITQSSVVSKHNQMNSSIEFVYQSALNNSKQYKLRLFRNGMLQIPGVTDCYAMSEVKGLVGELISLYQLMFECRTSVQVMNHHIAMCNYLAEFKLLPAQRLDIVKAYIDHKAQPNKFIDLCRQFQLECVHFEVAVRRVVLYVKFLIPKQHNAFSTYNASSTSNRK